MLNIATFEKMQKFNLPENEREFLQNNMETLVKSFEKLEAIDTNNAVPMFTVLPLTNVLREDVSKKIFARDDLLKTAPESMDGYFQVPKTIE